MTTTRGSPRRTTRGRLAWLKQETTQWVHDGLIDEPARARILDGYVTESSERRGVMALALVAVLMCGIGLLLLIGYNWARIPAAVKLTMVFAAVASTFAAAAIAYARQRSMVGEMLALAGTFIFGNGIWLIADVLHIQGHFPDAFFWFAAGATAVAALLESRYIGLGAAILVGLWILAEGVSSPRPSFIFIPLWTFLLVLAYRTRLKSMLCVVAFLAPLWVSAATADGSVVWLGATLITAAAIYFAGTWRPTTPDIRQAWQATGLAALLLTLIPLMVADVHKELAPVKPTTVSVAIAAVVGLLAIASALTRTRDVRDVGVACAATASVVWMLVVGSGVVPQNAAAPVTATILFSAAALVLAVSLIRSALQSGSTSDLAFGVLFAVAFLIVRWVSVLENLLWSGGLLLATGAGLLWIAKMWRRREPARAAGGVS